MCLDGSQNNAKGTSMAKNMLHVGSCFLRPANKRKTLNMSSEMEGRERIHSFWKMSILQQWFLDAAKMSSAPSEFTIFVRNLVVMNHVRGSSLKAQKTMRLLIALQSLPSQSNMATARSLKCSTKLCPDHWSSCSTMATLHIYIS